MTVEVLGVYVVIVLVLLTIDRVVEKWEKRE